MAVRKTNGRVNISWYQVATVLFIERIGSCKTNVRKKKQIIGQDERDNAPALGSKRRHQKHYLVEIKTDNKHLEQNIFKYSVYNHVVLFFAVVLFC
jgi:hypothetical protein